MQNIEFSLYNIKNKEIIDIFTGSKLGFIKDFKIDIVSYRIVSIILPLQKNSWITKNNCIEIPWGKIQKIGVDVILIDGSDISFQSK